MRTATKALVGVQFAIGCAVAAYAVSAMLLAERPGGLSLMILLAAYVPYAGVGSILVARRPRNVIGWVLLGMGWTFAVSFLPIDATAHELQTQTASPLAEAIAWLTEMDGVTHVRPVRHARVHLSDRQARARSLAAAGGPRAGAGLGDRDRLGVLAGVQPGSDRRHGHRRVPEPDRPPAADDPRGRPSVASDRHRCSAAHHRRVHRGDRRSLRGRAGPGTPPAALARGGVRRDRGRNSRRFPDHHRVRP